MIRKLTKVGGSLTLVLSPQMLKHLGIEVSADAEIDVVEDGANFVIKKPKKNTKK